MSEVTNTPAAPAQEQSNGNTPTPQSTPPADSTDPTAGLSFTGEEPTPEELSEVDQIDQAQANGEITKKEAESLKKKFKLKVDGEESEVEVDLGNEEELKKYLQMAKAFQKRGGDFTKAKAQMEQFVAELEANPEEYFSKKGVDLDKWATERLQKKIAELEKSPEQLAQEKLQAELEQLRKEKQEAEAEKQKIAQERAKDEQAKILEDQLTQALTKTGSRLPDKDPYFLQQVSAYMLSQMAQGNHDIDIESTIKVLENNLRKDHQGFYGKMSEQDIIDFIGEENFHRARKHWVNSKKSAIPQGAKTTTAKQAAQDTGTKRPVNEEPKSKKRMRDFFGKV